MIEGKDFFFFSQWMVLHTNLETNSMDYTYTDVQLQQTAMLATIISKVFLKKVWDKGKTTKVSLSKGSGIR